MKDGSIESVIEHNNEVEAEVEAVAKAAPKSDMQKRIDEVIERTPIIGTREALEQMAMIDPVVWTMYKRRLVGHGMTFDMARHLTPDALATKRKEFSDTARGQKEYERSVTELQQRHRPWQMEPLRDDHPHKAYQKGRQIGITEISFTEAVCFLDQHPNTILIYAWPRHAQLETFSTTRLATMFIETPRMRALLTGVNQLVIKKINQSHMVLRSAWDSALGEGVNADVVVLDEKDRMKSGVEAAFRESMSASSFGWLREVSTPSLPNRGVNASWLQSDMREWFVKCSKCGLKQPITADSIKQQINLPFNCKELPADSYAYICSKAKCGGKLDRVTGEWVAKRPSIKKIRGYHMPQTIAEWIDATLIMQKKINLKFLSLWINYVLGETSLGEGTLLTEADFDLANAGHKLVDRRDGNWSVISVGIDWGHCHDDQTRVLTDRGFVLFKDLIKTDRVAQLDVSSREMSFCKPISVTRKSYEGELINFTGAGVDMMVTPEHRMRVGNRWTGEWKNESAVTMAERKHATLIGTVAWDGDEVAQFKLPGLPSSPGYAGCETLDVAMDVWLEFLGYYLSEGGLCFARKRWHETRPSCHPENVDKMRQCLQATGLRYSEFPNTKTTDVNWTIYGKQLWSWVREHIGESCFDKRIPRQFLNLSRRQLQILFDAMMLGDGSRTKRGGIYYSSARGLCDDVQELCIKLGLRASVYLTSEAEGNRKARWRVGWSGGKDRFWARMDEHVARVPYIGEVYCCTVPKGYIVTERNGHIAYQGNSNWVVVQGLNTNGRKYILNMKVFEDQKANDLGAVRAIDAWIEPFQPDIIIADDGYGKDRNAYLLRRYKDQKFFAARYNPSAKGGVTFTPRWSPTGNQVLVDRTASLKNYCRLVRDREIGFPHRENAMTLALEAHLKAWAPMMEEDDDTGEIIEVIKNTGDDHLAHCAFYAELGMDHLLASNNFQFSF